MAVSTKDKIALAGLNHLVNRCSLPKEYILLSSIPSLATLCSHAIAPRFGTHFHPYGTLIRTLKRELIIGLYCFSVLVQSS